MANLVVLLALVASAAAFKSDAVSSLSFDEQDAKNNPVSKVVTLLKDMQKALGEEAKADEEVYDAFACWCESNDKEKSKAIADATKHIADLNIAIEELTAASARINQEIKTLEKEVNKNQGSLGKATEMRMEDQGEFNAEEKDLLASISALGAALTVLNKHHASASLLQIKSADANANANANAANLSFQRQMKQISASVTHVIETHKDILDGVILPSDKKRVLAFVQQAPSAGSYAPASGQIVGILKQMKETFESNLAQTHKDEKNGQSDYENLKSTKEYELTAAIDQIEAKTQELATTDEKLADSKTDLEDTTTTKESDEKFLANVRAQCQVMDAEWEARTKERTLEIEACSKAMEVLDGDEAHALFSKTFNFVQKEEVKHSKRRDVAAKILTALGRKNNNPKLVTLALSIRLDSFAKVKKAIDDMVADLMKQQADEVKLKDYCTESLNVNQRNTEDKDRTKKDLEATIEDLTITIDDLKNAIATLKAEIKEMQFQFKRAGEDREKENVEFQSTVADQRATQKLLTQALEILKGFYAKKAKAALAQTGKGEQTPPGGFKPYKKNESSGGVMGMIQTIIDDAKAVEAEAITAESDAQKAYETFVKDTNAGIDSKSKSIVSKSEELAKADAENIKTKETLENIMADLEELAAESADLHGECDFVLKNFAIRQGARMAEIESLKMVKAILSGAKFGAFLESSKEFTDSSGTLDAVSSAPAVDPLDGFLGSQ